MNFDKLCDRAIKQNNKKIAEARKYFNRVPLRFKDDPVKDRLTALFSGLIFVVIVAVIILIFFN